MYLILILIIGFYFYKTGDLQRWMSKIPTNTSNENAREVLDLRLAKGEISVDEYEKIKNII